MSQPSPADQLTHLRALLAQWSFSKETAFRLPELLDELRQSSDWFSLKILKLGREEENSRRRPKLTFVRRKLLKPCKGSEVSRLCKNAPGYFSRSSEPVFYEWINSEYFNDLPGILADGTRSTSEIVDAAITLIEKLRSAIHAFVLELAKHELLWRAIISDVFKDTLYRQDGEVSSFLLTIAQFETLGKAFSEQTPREREETFSAISHLYSLYSRISHVGYIEWTLTQFHFTPEEQDCFQAGRPRTLAYLHKTEQYIEGEQLPKFCVLNKLKTDGVLEDLTIAPRFSKIPRPTEQRSGCFRIDGDIYQGGDVETLYIRLFNIFNPEVSGKEAFHQITVPVYAYGSAKVANHRELRKRWSLTPAGAFLGWLVMDVTEDVFNKTQTNSAHYGEEDFQGIYEDLLDIRDFLNPFAEKYLLGEMEWVLDHISSDKIAPLAFTSENVHNFSGWHEPDTAMNESSFSGFVRFFAGTSASLREVTQDNYGPGKLRPSDIEWVQINVDREAFKESRGAEQTLTLRRDKPTALPSTFDELNRYGIRFAQAVRQFYESVKMRKAERASGRVLAAEEAYSKTAHQLRKLTRHIHKDTTSDDLDALRRYLALTFLSPKNLQDGAAIRLARDIADGGEFGQEFIRGRTVREMVGSAYRYAAILYPLLMKLHNAGTEPGLKPRLQLTFSRHKQWQYLLWNHKKALSALGDNPLKPEDTQLLQAKVFWYAALVALWLNTMEHSPRGSRVRMSLDPSSELMIMQNQALKAVRAHGSVERSIGTEHTLNYYFKSCFPENSCRGSVSFPEAPERGVFTTKIPIPMELLCRKS